MRLLARYAPPRHRGLQHRRDIAVNSTAEGPASRPAERCSMESDYELARDGDPRRAQDHRGLLVVAAEQRDAARAILTEGYCQYGTAFVEDDWEVAKFAKNLDDDRVPQRARDQHLHALPQLRADARSASGWQKDLFGTPDAVDQAASTTTGRDQRTPLMWAALALGSHDQPQPDARRDARRTCRPSKADPRRACIEIAQRGQIDGTSTSRDTAALRRAAPHRARHAVQRREPQFGGDPTKAEGRVRDRAAHHRRPAPDGKMLLARTLMALSRRPA